MQQLEKFPEITILRPKEVSDLLGLTTRHIRNLERQGDFPPKVRLGPKSVGWRLIDLQEWINSRLVGGGQ